MMIPCVVNDQHHRLAVASGLLFNLLQESPACFRVELVVFPAIDEFPVPDSHGAEIADAFPPWLLN